ncbi:MAG: hypothetical protein KatS3mg096_560 [Candidatus Parcubacteria bacterium]|nr:MAG: hypothetical protein KatS3mg095_0959 [Candidatus Parcubacteria bacterium]GIW67692.1 MAG: hypothetical protein KatS3mg096_560 [Candidatus Parcubacteria bacterium]
MNKNFIVLALAIVLVLVIGSYFVFFKKQPEKTNYQVTESYQAPQKIETTENVYKIKGLGFKREAWAEYKMEGYGWKFRGGDKEEIVGKILVKLISPLIKGKEYQGVEIDGKEGSPFEGYIFAMVFNREGQENYYLIKPKRGPTLCMNQKISGYEEVPEYFDRKSIESEYKVDLSMWQFVGEEEITLESGKQIKVYKFKIPEGGFGTRELWLSPQVPTYLVLNKETLSGVSRSITLTNFGMDGGLPNFTDEDLKACESGIPGLPGGSLGIPQLPSSEVSKLFCQSDADCACGVDKETKKCAFGNKNFIDTSKQCPDFCSGIAGQFIIKCVNNICTPTLR